jgi:hypothetical protein
VVIKSNLFSRGHPLKVEAGLSDALERRKHSVINKIRAISDLDLMTDAFLERLVRESLVAPLAVHFDKMTRKLRTETLDASYLPAGSMGARRYARMGSFPLEGGNQKQVARLTIPFSGEGDLLKFSPNPCGTTFPQGEVSGKAIQFDVILWGSPDDAERVKGEIRKNCDLIADYAGKINQQVKAFNESLPAQVQTAFTAKLEGLTKQHAVFDDLGIPEELDAPDSPSSPAPAKRRTAKAQAVHITQYVEKMYVQQLNQTNYNAGDVNTVIQGAN